MYFMFKRTRQWKTNEIHAFALSQRIFELRGFFLGSPLLKIFFFVYRCKSLTLVYAEFHTNIKVWVIGDLKDSSYWSFVYRAQHSCLKGDETQLNCPLYFCYGQTHLTNHAHTARMQQSYLILPKNGVLYYQSSYFKCYYYYFFKVRIQQPSVSSDPGPVSS